METTDDVAQAQALVGNLSPQELEFLRGIVAGKSEKAIAYRLDLSETETGAMKRSLMRKLKANVTADAVRVGIYAGL